MPNNEVDEISVGGTITYNEFKKHNAYHYKKIVIGYFIFVFFLTVCFVLLITGSLMFPITLIIVLLVTGLFTILLSKTFQRRVYKEFHSDTIATKEIRYTINNDGIHQQTGRSNVYIKWGDIIKGYEHKDMFCLYISHSKAILLPKRYFDSNEDILSFKKLIRKYSEKIKLKK